MTIEKKQAILGQAIKDFNEIKQSIINSGVEITEQTPTADFDEKIVEVREAGYDEGFTDGIEQGKTDNQKEFCEKYQQSGKRNDYRYAFYGEWWTDELFNPLYPIQWTISGTYMFSNTGITEINIPVIAYNGNVGSYVFSSANIKTIADLTVFEKTTFNGWFSAATSLETLGIKGIIGQNGFNTSKCTKLDKVSHENIINCLSGTETDLTVTLSLEAVNNAFETETGLADGSTSQEWLELVATKSNWTISLV